MKRNAVLADRIASLGLTQEQVADQLNQAIKAATGTVGGCSSRYVRQLLAGRIHWPRKTQREALEAVFGLPMQELGFRAPNVDVTGPES